MTKLIQGLRNEGMVRTRLDKSDRRVVHVSVTKKGAAVLEKARLARVDHIALGMETLSAHELETLDRAAAIMQRMVATRQSSD